MSTVWQNIQFHASFAWDSIAVSFHVLNLLILSAVHYALGNDPKLKFAYPSLESLRTKSTNATTTADRLANYPYQRPIKGFSRSPCPALNLMANHGYIPRDGRGLNGTVLTHGLMECYNLSWPLAAFLSWGGVLLLGQVGLFSLHDLARHNRVEHNGSVTHGSIYQPTDSVSDSSLDNTESDLSSSSSQGSGSGFSASSGTSVTSVADEVDEPASYCNDDEYAPCNNDPLLYKSFLADARNGHYTVHDIARTRVRREKSSNSSPRSSLTAMQQEIARGESALVLQIFSSGSPRQLAPDELRVSVDKICAFWGDERLPKDWVPTRQTTLLGTMRVASTIRQAMFKLRSEEAKGGASAGRKTQ